MCAPPPPTHPHIHRCATILHVTFFEKVCSIFYLPLKYWVHPMFQQHGHLHEHSTGRPGERAFHGLHKYTIDVIRTYITKKTRKIPIHPQWSNDMTGKSVPRMCMVTRKFKSRMLNLCTTGTYPSMLEIWGFITSMENM